MTTERARKKWSCPICGREPENDQDRSCDRGHEPTAMRGKTTARGKKLQKKRQLARIRQEAAELRKGADRLQAENDALRRFIQSYGLNPKDAFKDAP